MNMPVESIKNLIICDPYKAPNLHWKYDRKTRKFSQVSGRRPAGYLIATQDSKSFDDPGEFKELKLVNVIRKQVDKWREDGYPNVTGVTKMLLDHWHKEKDINRFFYCQLEAIETIIWFTESHGAYKRGVTIPGDGGNFERLCTKMATGTGKTVVMSMLIAWQTINKITYPKDPKFSKSFLIVTPGLTVKKRLEVLNPKNYNNYYQEFQIVPDSQYSKLYDAKIVIHNWHTLKRLEDEKFSVVKKGTESKRAFAKRILGFENKNIIVINDEAHHAWRKTLENETLDDGDVEIATRWIEGLDNIHETRNILKCYDFSATPFIPTGKNVEENMLFGWIISDFSLNDAIESGLTKTPKISIQDDSGKYDENYKSRFYHLYVDPEVYESLNQKASASKPIPDLVTNAYMVLGEDWLKTKIMWDKQNARYKLRPIPPVLVTVCNNTHTSARVNYAFEKNKFSVNELSDKKHILHIDSSALKKAEVADKDKKSDKVELLRQKINSVGKPNTVGEQLRNIIAVQMLTEGWDAHNVTHIMGLRAFTSQLLCEQVVGRGLRRMSYDIDPKTDLLEPEYVNIFGVPFTFLPHEGGVNDPPRPPVPTTIIEPDITKSMHEISWPNIDRINVEYNTVLDINWDKIKTLKLYSNNISTTVGMAAVLEGKPHVDKMTEIDLHKLNKKIRLQTIIFIASKDVYNEIELSWKGNKEFLISQIIKLTEKFIELKKIRVLDVSSLDKLRARMTILFNMQSVVKCVCNAINEKSVKQEKIMLNVQCPIKSTKHMRTWRTRKPVEYALKSHINLAVYDSKLEISVGSELDKNNDVVSWVKNDHIGFVIKYFYDGRAHDYYPDFLIRLKNNVMLVLEAKGKDDEQNKIKREYLKNWTSAVNRDGSYGTWVSDVVFNQTEVRGIIHKHMKSDQSSGTKTRCPSCSKTGKGRQAIEKEFGFRVVDGIIRPQSWCRACRSKSQY